MRTVAPIDEWLQACRCAWFSPDLAAGAGLGGTRPAGARRLGDPHRHGRKVDFELTVLASTSSQREPAEAACQSEHLFNRRFDLRAILIRLAKALAACTPLPYSKQNPDFFVDLAAIPIGARVDAVAVLSVLPKRPLHRKST